MTYQETIKYLYDSVPMFQKVGTTGYKEGLENTLTLDKHFNHPHKNFRTIHIAGTNGKGSCSHTLAAILQHAGYKTGLYTSPHLLDFRERIRINGTPISEDYVIDFVEQHRHFFEPLHPSFFELSTAMAYKYFSDNKVDIAIIEVGLGGRLDCTNIISPILSVITNISFDHTQFLGNTLAAIASEKAGIIKQNTPTIIGESNSETKPVFISKAQQVNSTIIFAEDTPEIISSQADYTTGGRNYNTHSYGQIRGALGGLCQVKNTNTILHTIPYIIKAGYNISTDDINEGFANLCRTTGLMGRWQKISDNPRIICDTGHNEGGFKYISEQLNEQIHVMQPTAKMRIVFGMVSDKDITKVLDMLPKEATYYFTKASIKRAFNEKELKKVASTFGLEGHSYPTVADAYKVALSDAEKDDFIFIGGSTYVIADLMTHLKNKA